MGILVIYTIPYKDGSSMASVFRLEDTFGGGADGPGVVLEEGFGLKPGAKMHVGYEGCNSAFVRRKQTM